MEKFTKILETIDGYVWGIPLIVLIMAVGIFLTFRLRLLQIFHLPKALKFMFQNENGGKGEISSFAALCTALSAECKLILFIELHAAAWANPLALHLL